MLEILQEEWAIRALLASMAVGISCGILGCFIVLRNMSMVGDALSHAILPGVVLAFFIFGTDSSWGFFLGAVLAGWVCSFLITWIQTKVSTKNDAAVGIVFTCMFSLGVIGITFLDSRKNVHIDLKDYLFGNILGVSDSDLYVSLMVTLTVVAGVMIFYRSLFLTTFQSVVARTMGVNVERVHYFLMLLLSFAIVSALRTVGVILVVAMLITPASTSLLLFKRLPNVILFSAFLGLGTAIGGFFLSLVLDAPPGPLMAVLATALYVLAVIFSPTSGLLIRSIQSTREKQKIRQEDIIKCIHMHNNRGISVDASLVAEKLEINPFILRRAVRSLVKKGLLEASGFELTRKGKKRGEQLIRAHRLWETYMVNKMGMDSDQIHDEAERLEHHLSEEIINEVAADLDFPDMDPHGSPIPKGVLSLIQVGKGQRFRIASEQELSVVVSDLWSFGLMPKSEWIVEERAEKEILLYSKETGKRRIPLDLAKKVEIERL